jgi:hypothetical protein
MTQSTESRAIAHFAEWLGMVADTAAAGEIVSEQALGDGYVVATRWPTQAAYRQHARHIRTIAMMVDEDRRARQGCET